MRQRGVGCGVGVAVADVGGIAVKVGVGVGIALTVAKLVAVVHTLALVEQRRRRLAVVQRLLSAQLLAQRQRVGHAQHVA